MKDDHDEQLSEGAEELDIHVRDLVSDLTDADVRRRPSDRLRDLRDWRAAVVGMLVVVTILFAIFYNPRNPEEVGGEAATGPSTTSTVGSDGPGPLGGTWEMYWTHGGTESSGFTVRFVDSREVGEDSFSGLVEIPEDETEHDTTFLVEGDEVWFTFTRLFDVDEGTTWPEVSEFEGTLTPSGELVGEWIREDWDCRPERQPRCATKPDPARYPSRLVRQQ